MCDEVHGREITLAVVKWAFQNMHPKWKKKNPKTGYFFEPVIICASMQKHHIAEDIEWESYMKRAENNVF